MRHLLSAASEGARLPVWRLIVAVIGVTSGWVSGQEKGHLTLVSLLSCQRTYLMGEKPAGTLSPKLWGLSLSWAREREGERAGAVLSLPLMSFLLVPSKKQKTKADKTKQRWGGLLGIKAEWIPHLICFFHPCPNCPWLPFGTPVSDRWPFVGI